MPQIHAAQKQNTFILLFSMQSLPSSTVAHERAQTRPPRPYRRRRASIPAAPRPTMSHPPPQATGAPHWLASQAAPIRNTLLNIFDKTNRESTRHASDVTALAEHYAIRVRPQKRVQTANQTHASSMGQSHPRANDPGWAHAQART